MNVTIFAVVVAVSLAVGACSVRGPEFRVDPYPHGEVRSHPSAGFCPPGLAKQGRC